jgi:hypothetical protein
VATTVLRAPGTATTATNITAAQAPAVAHPTRLPCADHHDTPTSTQPTIVEPTTTRSSQIRGPAAANSLEANPTPITPITSPTAHTAAITRTRDDKRRTAPARINCQTAGTPITAATATADHPSASALPAASSHSAVEQYSDGVRKAL